MTDNSVTEVNNKNLEEKNPKIITYDDDDVQEDEQIPGIKFVNYRDEAQIHSVMRLVGKDLSEPYSSEYCTLGLVLLRTVMVHDYHTIKIVFSRSI